MEIKALEMMIDRERGLLMVPITWGAIVDFPIIKKEQARLLPVTATVVLKFLDPETGDYINTAACADFEDLA